MKKALMGILICAFAAMCAVPVFAQRYEFGLTWNWYDPGMDASYASRYAPPYLSGGTYSSLAEQTVKIKAKAISGLAAFFTWFPVSNHRSPVCRRILQAGLRGHELSVCLLPDLRTADARPHDADGQLREFHGLGTKRRRRPGDCPQPERRAQTPTHPVALGERLRRAQLLLSSKGRRGSSVTPSSGPRPTACSTSRTSSCPTSSARRTGWGSMWGAKRRSTCRRRSRSSVSLGTSPVPRPTRLCTSRRTMSCPIRSRTWKACWAWAR